MKKADAIVVGAGHNGLAAAARLAGAGRRVLVVEAREVAGGLCAGEEFHPGYRTPGLLHDAATFSPLVEERLGLARHGLRRGAPEPIFTPDPEGAGRGLLLAARPRDAADELAAHAPADAAAYGSWQAFLDRVRPLVRRVLQAPPPPLAPASAAELWEVARRGLALRRLGRRDMTELLRVTPMCVADWLRERFASPLLCQVLAAPAVVGTWSGPWSAGTAANLLLHRALVDRPVAGGPAAVAEALLAACRSLAVEVRTGAPVRRISLAGNRVAGVVLESGEEIAAGAVVAACDPRQVFLRLLPPGSLPLRIEEQAAAFRSRGTTAKVHLALSGPLTFAGREEATITAAQIGGGDLDALERAFDAVKYRRFSRPPHLEVRVPTVADPSLAPPGCHVVSILVSFTPRDLEGGWSGERREELGDTAVGTLARHAPGLEERIVAREVLTPRDIEERYRTSGGSIHHGEHALDQLFSLRPAPWAARYRTPVEGLFLAGSGSHPGGGVTGLPGWLGAGAALAG